MACDTNGSSNGAEDHPWRPPGSAASTLINDAPPSVTVAPNARQARSCDRPPTAEDLAPGPKGWAANASHACLPALRSDANHTRTGRRERHRRHRCGVERRQLVLAPRSEGPVRWRFSAWCHEARRCPTRHRRHHGRADTEPPFAGPPDRARSTPSTWLAAERTTRDPIRIVEHRVRRPQNAETHEIGSGFGRRLRGMVRRGPMSCSSRYIRLYGSASQRSSSTMLLASPSRGP